MSLPPDIDLHMKIFHPIARSEYYRFECSKRPFVYYTRAPTAVSIINKGEFWMREVSRMNDYREVQHGLECIEAAFKSAEGARTLEIFESTHPGVVTAAQNILQSNQANLLKGTYIACISEHGDQTGEEDSHGRLSMWRAYGSTTGVALILNPAPYFYSGSSNLNVFISPVAYLRDDGYIKALRDINNAAQAHLPVIQAYGAERTKLALVNVLRFAAICGKHPGFSEEREWRVLWNPTFGSPAGLIESQETINGVEQTIYKMPIQNIPGLGAEPTSSLIQRVIIGPCEKPEEIFEQLREALLTAGVKQPENRIVRSDIPLRSG